MTDNDKNRIEHLYPSDWNPSDEEFEELEAEYPIATDTEGWAEIEKEREKLYLETVKVVKYQVKQQ